MKRFALLAALAAGFTLTSGCQTSGEAEVDTESRPAMRGQAGGGAGGAGAAFNLSYTATADTEYVSTPDGGGPRGTIRRGSQVRFESAPDTTQDWQRAQMENGTVVYVRPADFRSM